MSRDGRVYVPDIDHDSCAYIQVKFRRRFARFAFLSLFLIVNKTCSNN